MKKIAAGLLVLCLCFGLAACGNTATNSEALLAPSSRFDVGRILDKILSLFSELGTDDPGIAAPAPETGKPGTDAPSVATPVPEEMTLENFLEGKVGIWILDSTIERYNEHSITFALIVLSESSCSTGYYPGEMDRPGVYENFTQIDSQTYQIGLLYKEGEYWGEYMPEKRNAMVFRSSAVDTLEIRYSDGSYHKITYGGRTFEDAAETALRLVPYVPPTEQTPAEQESFFVVPSTRIVDTYTDYRIIREDLSCRTGSGEVLISQYWDYVELTADTPTVKKINNALKPTDETFLLEAELLEYAEQATADFPFINEYTSAITYNSKEWLCVTTVYQWFMGGVHNGGYSAAVFDAATGDQVTLRAFAGEDPETFEAQIKQIVWEYIQPQEPWDSAYDALSNYTLDTFNFAISNGQIILYFPEYEFFPGSHGPVTVESGLYIE